MEKPLWHIANGGIGVKGLDEIRKEISAIDEKMAQLFEKRMEAAAEVAAYKKEHALPIFDGGRENELIKRNSQIISDSVIREYYVDFLKNNMSLSRAYQARLNEGLRVAYSGVEGAFAYIAAKRMYPEATLVSYPDFESAYRAAEGGECDAAVLPIENSFAGDVSTVMDLLFSGTLYVNSVLDLEINHCLIGVKGATVNDVKTVMSHPQALMQCDKYIKEHEFAIVGTQNTAASAKSVKELGKKEFAAIASEETAKLFDLEIIEKGINQSRTNTTRFFSFSRAQNMLASDGKHHSNEHFILVFTVKNEAGALAKTIDIIGAHRFNMRNLRSRPMKELLWSYYFFVEADGNINTQNGKDMLRELSATCDICKLVGTYRS